MKRSELKRTTGLKRGGGNLKRKTELARKAKRKVELAEHRKPVAPKVLPGTGEKHKAKLHYELEKKMFRDAARSQRVCQAPGCEHPSAADWQAHHVVYEQELRRLRLPTLNVRNAMRLCKRCHERHHNRSRALPLSALTDTHIAYAVEVLGDRAMDYLRQRYATEETT